MFTVYFMGGISSCNGATVKTNAGTTAAMSVASFTPATGATCIGIGNELAGASATYAQVNPFLDDNGGLTGAAPNTSPNFGNHYSVAILRGAWNANDGTTMATITPSASSTPTWDEVVVCYLASSAGNDAYNEGYRGGPRQNTNMPGEGVNGIQKGDYIIQFTGIGGTAITVSSISDNNGGSDTWSKVGGSDTYNDIEIWTAQAAQTTSGGSGFGVTDTLSGTAAASFVIGYNIGSIDSTTPEVFTNSGTSSTISLASFTPNAGDLCLEAASTITGSGSTTFSVPANQPFQNFASVGPNSGLANFYVAFAVRANWPAGVSTTGTITMSGTSSPQWDVVVVCFPGTVVVPLTCTMVNSAPQATITLTESSGNALSPSSVACNGAVHNITVDPSVTLTAHEPADSLNSRYRFSGGASTLSDVVCAGSSNGQCSAWSLTNYYQLQNTYLIWPHPVNATWNSGLTFTETGTVVGVGGSAVCSISPPGSSAPSTPAGVVDFIPIPLTNTQSSAVAGGTQVEVYMNWNAYSSYLNSQSSNVVFFNSAGTPLNAWMQSFTSTSDTSDPIWIQLDSSGIPASSSVTIYIGFYTLATNNLSPTGDWGEAPTISSTYGQYDNGAKVFTVYDNFAGSTLSSNWVAQASAGGSYTVNNGITFNVGSATDYTWVHSANAETYPLTVESDMISQSGSAYITLADSLATTLNTPYGEPYNGYDYDWYSGYVEIDDNTATNSLSTKYATTSFNPGVWSFSWYATGHQMGTDGVHPLTDTNPSHTIANYYLYLGIGEYAKSSFTAQWYRARITPPNNVLPSYSPQCSGWSDYNKQVSFPTNPAGSAPNTRWQVDTDGDQTVTPTTGGNTFQEDYWSQLQNTFQATPNTNWDSSLTFAPTGSFFGVAGSTLCTISPTGGSSSAASCTAWADSGSTATFPAQATGCPADHCWFATGTTSFSITAGGNSFNVNYDRNFPRSASDAYVFSESPSRITLLPRAAIDSFSFSEAVGRLVSLPRLPGDAFVFAESASTNLIFSRSAPDSFAFSDVANRGLIFGRGAPDSIGFSDAPARSDILTRSPGDSTPFSEVPTGMSAFTRVISDSFGFLEATLSNIFLVRSAGDTFAFADLPSHLVALFRSVIATYTFGDFLGLLKHFGFLVHDAFTFGDSVARMVALFGSIVESLLFGDSVARGLALLRGVTDFLPIGLTTVAIVAQSVAIGDIITFLETALSTITSGVHTTTTSGGGFVPAYNIVFFLPLLIILLVLLILIAAYLKRRRRGPEEPPASDG